MKKILLISITIIFLIVGTIFIVEHNKKTLSIVLVGDTTVYLNEGIEFNDPGYIVYENKKNITNTADVTIINNINYSSPGTYKIEYKMNNKVYAERKVILSFEKKKEYTLVLKGNATSSIVVGEEYNDLGIYAYDNYGNILADKISVQGSVNTSIPGRYVLKYILETSDDKHTVIRTIDVVEKEILAKSIELPESYDIYVGDIITLNPTIEPANANVKKLDWKIINNNSVIEFNDGYVKGIKQGSATVTVVTDNGLTATTTINVKNREIPVEEIVLNKTIIEMNVGEELPLTVTIKPKDATNKNITFNSSNLNVAYVMNNKVIAVSPGLAVITVTSANGKETTCTVKVLEKSNEFIPVNNISITNKTNTIDVDDLYEIKYEILPKNATDKTVTFTSSNKNIATVDQNGIVSGINYGKVTITITSSNGMTDQVELTVNKDRIHSINIGVSGQAILLESKGKYALIDAGGSNSEPISNCSRGLYRYLEKYNVKELDFILLTHIHYDHVICLAGWNKNDYQGYLLDTNPKYNVKINQIIMKKYNGYDGKGHTDKYNAIVSKAGTKKVPINYVTTVTKDIKFGNFNIKLYNGQERLTGYKVDKPNNYITENSNSLVTTLTIKKNNKNQYTYISGDIENIVDENNVVKRDLEKIVSEVATRQITQGAPFDVYFASHHGYNSANTEGALGHDNVDGTISFKNVIVPNNITYLCASVPKTGATGIANIYNNLSRTNKKEDNDIYFSGERAVIVSYTKSGVKINGGTVLKCKGNNKTNSCATPVSARQTVVNLAKEVHPEQKDKCLKKESIIEDK